MNPANPDARGPVVVDTGVFAAELVRRGPALAEAYRALLEGRPYVVSFATVAEVRYGANLAGWGAPRRRRLEQRLARCRIVWPGPQLVGTYADLRTACVNAGHPLGQQAHEADRWIAATAVLLDIPLVSHDKIFRDVPDLELVTRLPSGPEPTP